MHGGAAGSGAREGNRNALKHGRYTAEAVASRRLVRELVRAARALVGEVESGGRRGPGCCRGHTSRASVRFANLLYLHAFRC